MINILNDVADEGTNENDRKSNNVVNHNQMSNDDHHNACYNDNGYRITSFPEFIFFLT